MGARDNSRDWCGGLRDVFLIILLLTMAGSAGGQEAVSLAERLHAADAGSALDAPDMKSWHLKITVHLFDEKGKATEQGTIEEWWGGPQADRRTYTMPTYTATEILEGYKLRRTTGVGPPPYFLDLLRRQVVHPMPDVDELAAPFLS